MSTKPITCKEGFCGSRTSLRFEGVADDEPLLPTGEIARRLGVSTSAVAQWVQRGLLTPTIVTPGGRYRWRWSDVERQMREQRQRDE